VTKAGRVSRRTGAVLAVWTLKTGAKMLKTAGRARRYGGRKGDPKSLRNSDGEATRTLTNPFY